MTALAEEAEELAALRKEYDWIVQRDVPSALKHLGTALRSCLEAFHLRRPQEAPKRSPSLKRMDRTAETVRMVRRANPIDMPRPSDAASSPLFEEGHSTEASFKSADGGLHAKLCVTGLNLSFVQVTYTGFARVPRGRAPILNAGPWTSTKRSPLAQLQTVVNYVDLCLLTIEEWSSLQSASAAIPTQPYLSRMVERVCTLLTAARATLSPPVAPLPEEYLLDKLSFTPLPTANLFFSAYVDGATIVLRMIQALPLSGPPSAPHKNVNDALRVRGGVGHLFSLQRDQWFEVTARHDAVCELGFLKEAAAALHTAQQLAQRLQDKANAFSMLA